MQGDNPDNMKAFWKFLLRKSLPPDSLAAVKFAVFGLGDSTYVTYNVSRSLHTLYPHEPLHGRRRSSRAGAGHAACCAPWSP